MKLADEKVKEFWTRHGFKFFQPVKDGAIDVIYPDGSTCLSPSEIAVPEINLSNLVKYAIPFLLEKHTIIETYSFKQDGGLYYSETGIWDRNESQLKGKLVSKAFAQDFGLEKATVQALSRALDQVSEQSK